MDVVNIHLWLIWSFLHTCFSVFIKTCLFVFRTSALYLVKVRVIEHHGYKTKPEVSEL